MKYCLNFSKSNSYIDEVAEINIIWKDHSTIDGLINFLNNHYKQRVNVSFQREYALPAFLKEIVAARNFDCKNMYIKITKEIVDSVYIDDIEMMNEMNIPYYFDTLVFDWSTFYGLSELGVSDIYISGSLGFSCSKIKRVAESKNIQVRAIANVAQSNWAYMPAHLRFFIRPEDVQSYEGFIDILEFSEVKSEATLYEIYQRGKWDLQTRFIINNFDSEIYNNTIAPIGFVRLHCEQKCFYGADCRICEKLFKLGETLESAGYSLKKIDE